MKKFLALVILLLMPSIGWALSGTTDEIEVQDGAIGIVDPLAVTKGGTGLATLTQYNLIVGAGTADVQFVAPGTSGRVLLDAGAAANPAFGQLDLAANLGLTGILDVPNGGTGVNTLGDAGVLIGNDAGVVNVTTAGTTGQVLVSNGAAVNPAFEALDLDDTDAVTGTLSLANGGTNQSTGWTAGYCVKVNAGGTALEVAGGPCGTSSAPYPLLGFGTGMDITANKTVYVGMNGDIDLDVDRVAARVNNDVTVGQLACTNSAIQGTGNNVVITLMEGTCGTLAADVETVCTITGTTGADQPCTDEDAELIATNTCFAWRVVTPAALTANAVISCSFERTA